MSVPSHLHDLGLTDLATKLAGYDVLTKLDPNAYARIMYSILVVYSEIPGGYATSGIQKTLRGTGGLKKSAWFGALMGDKTLTNPQLTALIKHVGYAFEDASITTEDTTTEAPYWIGGTKRDKVQIAKLAADFHAACLKEGLTIDKTTLPTVKAATPKDQKAIVTKYLSKILLPDLAKLIKEKAEELATTTSQPAPKVSTHFPGSGAPNLVGYTLGWRKAISYLSRVKDGTTVRFTYLISTGSIYAYTGRINGDKVYTREEIYYVIRPAVEISIQPDGKCSHLFLWLSGECINAYSLSKWTQLEKPNKTPLV